jgi:NAD(P)-dependent dehydrogenase (short-subunit alcohol dehydrogenase family)
MKKTALITGAASGIGKGIAKKFLTEGWNAMLFDISLENLARTLSEFEGAGFANVKHYTGDVSNEFDVSNAVEFALNSFASIDCVVNNAGIGITKSVEELSLDEWRRVIDTNLTSVFLTAKHAASALKSSKGAIVNIASTRAFHSEANTEAYSASKGGIVAITHALSISLAPVRVNCVSPGWIDNGTFPPFTEADKNQHPVGRIGEPGDIAELAYFFASEKSSFITGQNFTCDGGMTKKMIYV